ncbi:MAG: ATP phosphoribosyltransferase [Oscillospiraceae bacterium]|nr:ATP phosphoribosyltransferase [Oscillospiraceae bacterium]
MELDLQILSPLERLSLELRQMYEAEGFRHYRMSRFEEYGFYQENRRFLSAKRALTFTDLDGRLMALKPDVTLSIAKNAPRGRFYYLENVYRPGRENQGFQEIRQMGVECVGDVDADTMTKAVSLAVRSLSATGRSPVLEIGHMGYVSGLLDALNVPPRLRGRLLDGIRDKSPQDTRDIEALFSLDGDWETVFPAASALAKNDVMREALRELKTLYASLSANPDILRHLRLNLSLVNDLEYYNGLVLQGFLEGIPRPVLRGGRYDPLVSRFHRGAKAVGFALYLDELEQVTHTGHAGMLSVALPKGRLGDKVYHLLESVGYGSPENYSDTRKLVVENPAAGIRYFLVKPSDVAIYVERGAADVGIVGKDILEEHRPDVYELLDTGLGRCRMCVAGKPDGLDVGERPLRVATKFVRIAKRHFAALGQDIDIIKLHGSIELAPLLGLSDVIVDIVETGTTLKENNLQVLREFMPISARFIANRSAYQFKREAIETLTEKLREVTGV